MTVPFACMCGHVYISTYSDDDHYHIGASGAITDLLASGYHLNIKI